MSTNAIAAARLEQPLPADPERAEFMRRLSEHEDAESELLHHAWLIDDAMVERTAQAMANWSDDPWDSLGEINRDYYCTMARLGLEAALRPGKASDAAEKFRMTRRSVVALYDHARLTRTETTRPDV